MVAMNKDGKGAVTVEEQWYRKAVNQNQADTVQSDVAACVVYNSNGREMYI